MKAFIDTSVWFKVAEDTKRLPEVAALEEMIRRGVVQLIVPRLAVKEFDRKRQNIALASETALGPHIRAVREAAISIGGPKIKQAAFLAYLDELSAHGPIDGGRVGQALDRIERLLLDSEIIEDSEDVTLAAAQRGIDKRAPFHTGNGMADAVLLETYAKCVRNSDPSTRFVFVTDNKSDFSLPKGNQNLPHPDLEDVFPAGKSHYFIDFLAALKHIEPNIVSEVLARSQPTFAAVIDKYLKANVQINTKPTLRLISRMVIAKKQVSKLRPSDYVEHARIRRKTVVGATAMQDFMALKNVLLWAQANMSADVSLDALERGKKTALKEGLIEPSKQGPVKRLSREDEQRLMAALLKRQSHPRNTINMTAIVQFALWSGRRLNEICNLKWADFHEGSSRCAFTSKGRRVRFPLLGKALEIIDEQRKIVGKDELIFPYNQKCVSQALVEVKKDLKLDITFDDLREEGIRRLLEARTYYPFELIQQLNPSKVLEIQAQLDAGKAI